MKPSQDSNVAAVIALETSGRWEVDLQDGKRILFAQSLTAELFAMRHVSEHGGGRVLIRDRHARAPRLIEIPGESGDSPPS